jgi:hypothetical protein
MIKTASFLIITLVLISVAIFTADLDFTEVDTVLSFGAD